MKTLLKKYKHAWILLYCPLYMMWFTYLESKITTNYKSIYMRLDDFFPFNEWFVIPYYLWFLFIVVVLGYFFFQDHKEFYRCCAFLFIGMTICLIIYSIWPNGQNLRPDLAALNRDNIAIQIIANLYRTDTNTNVCPSIHVFNSIGVCIGILHSEKLRKRKIITIPSIILAISICLATVFLKQHSVFDGICAIVLSFIMYVAVYVINYEKLLSKSKTYKKEEADFN